MDICELDKIANILGDLGQFAFGLVAIMLSIYALISKRKDIFQSELAKSQFDEIGKIRNQLSEIFFDITYVKDYLGEMNVGENLEEFKQRCPEQWEQSERYKNNSLSIFYKFMTPEYYLFPSWLDKTIINNHFETMKEFAPFTMRATGLKSSSVEEYQIKIRKLIRELDTVLSKNA